MLAKGSDVIGKGLGMGGIGLGKDGAFLNFDGLCRDRPRAGDMLRDAPELSGSIGLISDSSEFMSSLLANRSSSSAIVANVEIMRSSFALLPSAASVEIVDEMATPEVFS